VRQSGKTLGRPDRRPILNEEVEKKKTLNEKESKNPQEGPPHFPVVFNDRQRR
jgi:hypothetical protein